MPPPPRYSNPTSGSAVAIQSDFRQMEDGHIPIQIVKHFYDTQVPTDGIEAEADRV